MVIANPIYDVVFKMLMQNKRIAHFFIETVLEETVESIEVTPQELIYDKDNPDYNSVEVALALVRFDFVATIKTKSGGHKKVLIEVQKARHPMDIDRFRKYLGLHYQTKDVVYYLMDRKKVALPIVCIYILGFNLPEITVPICYVGRYYQDQLTKKIIDKKNDFIEKLTHDGHFVQLLRIEGKVQTKLEKLLTIFEQRYFIDRSGTAKDFIYDIEDPIIMEITEYLNYVILDPETKKKIDAEQEAYRVYNLGIEELEETHVLLEKANEKIEEIDKVLEEQNKALEEQNKALGEQSKTLEEQSKALEEQNKILEEQSKTLEEQNKALEEQNKVLNEKDKVLEEKDRELAQVLKELKEMKKLK